MIIVGFKCARAAASSGESAQTIVHQPDGIRPPNRLGHRTQRDALFGMIQERAVCARLFDGLGQHGAVAASGLHRIDDAVRKSTDSSFRGRSARYRRIAA